MGSADELAASSGADLVPIVNEKIKIVAESQGDDFGKPEISTMKLEPSLSRLLQADQRKHRSRRKS
jgi:hypothetical protein